MPQKMYLQDYLNPLHTANCYDNSYTVIYLWYVGNVHFTPFEAVS